MKKNGRKYRRIQKKKKLKEKSVSIKSLKICQAVDDIDIELRLPIPKTGFASSKFSILAKNSDLCCYSLWM